MSKSHEDYSMWGLTNHWSKIEYMGVGATTNVLDRGVVIKACSTYIHIRIGVKFDNEEKQNEMITAGMNTGRQVTMNSILWQKCIKTNTKMYIYETVMKKALIYRCEKLQVSIKMECRLLSTKWISSVRRREDQS